MIKYPLNRFCVDCGERLKHYGSKRCRSCSKKGKLHPLYGKPLTDDNRRRLLGYNKNRIYTPHTEETKEKIRLAKEKYLDCIIEHPGLLRRALINRWCWKKWRENVFNKSFGRCSKCGDLATEIHHRVHFVDIIENHGVNTIRKALNCLLLWDSNNGIALCNGCHKKEHYQCDMAASRFAITMKQQ